MVQVMSIITVLSLRSPNNAARAMEAGAGDLAIQAMLRFPSSQQLQRNSCLMIRNLVVRNPENRQVYLLPSTNNCHFFQWCFCTYYQSTKEGNHGSCNKSERPWTRG